MSLLRVDDPAVATIQRRAFCHFASSAERTQQVPAPEVGTVSVIGVLFEYWNGTSWVTLLGTAGPPGPEGPEGPQGDPGVGVPAGGTAGQALTKIDGADYNTTWTTVAAGTVILSGSGAPTSGVGNVGNYYEDTTNGVLYGPKGTGGAATGAILSEPFNDFTSAPWTNTSATIVAGRTATGAQITGVLANIRYAVPTPSQDAVMMVGAAVKITSLSAVQQVFGFRSDAGVTLHGTIDVTTTGAVRASNAAGVGVGSSAAGTIVAGTWAYIEARYTLADSPGGAVVVRVNGTEVINVTGIDTKNVGTKTVYDELRLGPPNASSGGTVTYDDLYVKVGAGATFEGDITIGGTVWPVAVRQLPRMVATTAPLTGGGDLTADRTLGISDFTSSARGTVPASGGGTTKFLRADATWQIPSGGTAVYG